MSEVVGKRFKHVSWNVKDNGAWCHQKRCKEAAVSHRLCAKHGAAWLSHGQQPPMPDYEGNNVDAIVALDNDTRDVEYERKALAALPMRDHHDAEVMKGQLLGARALIEQTREKKHAILKPIIHEARRMKNAHDRLIAAYKTCEDLALTRLEQMDQLHNFEVARPSKSGFPPRPQRASAAPRVTKKKTGRGRKRA